MADFGWAYLSGTAVGRGSGDSVQYIESANGELTGSANFTFKPTSNQLFLTGTMVISGTIQANTFDIIQTNVIEIDSSGSTNFGNDSGDSHSYTGSLAIVSGSFRQHYKKLLTGGSYNVSAFDTVIGVSASAYTSIQLPTALNSHGRIIVIKDERSETRTTTNPIGISCSVGGQTIDHGANYQITGDSAALSVYSDGVSKWFIY
jgi:hypothetical protein